MLFVVRARSNLALHFLQVIHRVGQVGLDLVTTIIIGDVSPLEWRGLFQGLNCECPLVLQVHCALIVRSKRSRPMDYQLLHRYV